MILYIMSQPLEAGNNSGRFLSKSTGELMNPDFGREGMPRLSIGYPTQETATLLDAADKVRDAFIASPMKVWEEKDHMSEALHGFVDQQLGGRLHMPAFRIGVHLAHKTYRTAGMLDEVTSQDIDSLTRSLGIDPSLTFSAFYLGVNVEHMAAQEALNNKVDNLTVMLRPDKQISVRLGYKYVGYISGNKTT